MPDGQGANSNRTMVLQPNHQRRRMNSSHKNLRLNAELLRINLGGTLNEADICKEAVKQLAYEQLLNLMPL